MVKKVKSITCTLLVLAFLFCCGGQLYGQEKVNIAGGAGFAETLHMGIRYQVLNQSQIGLSIGTWPSPKDFWLMDWESLLSISGDFYYHLGDSARFSDLSPWYIRIGLDYIRIAGTEYTDNNLESHLRLGRDFYFSRNYGISLDVGVACFLLNESGFTSVLPAFGASVFARF
jgi:hypothetical protein